MVTVSIECGGYSFLELCDGSKGREINFEII